MGRVSERLEKSGVEFTSGKRPWGCGWGWFVRALFATRWRKRRASGGGEGGLAVAHPTSASVIKRGSQAKSRLVRFNRSTLSYGKADRNYAGLTLTRRGSSTKRGSWSWPDLEASRIAAARHWTLGLPLKQ